MWHRKWAWLKFPGTTAPLVFQRKPLCQKSGYAPDASVSVNMHTQIVCNQTNCLRCASQSTRCSCSSILAEPIIISQETLTLAHRRLTSQVLEIKHVRVAIPTRKKPGLQLYVALVPISKSGVKSGPYIIAPFEMGSSAGHSFAVKIIRIAIGQLTRADMLEQRLHCIATIGLHTVWASGADPGIGERGVR